MEYLGNLVIIGIYFMVELKFDEQIRAELWRTECASAGTKLMHSFWQNAGRAVLIIAIVWNQPQPNELIVYASALMYVLFYWVGFDSVFAVGVLKQKPWFLGTTSKIDKLFPKWTHLPVWVLKLAAFAASVWWVMVAA